MTIRRPYEVTSAKQLQAVIPPGREDVIDAVGAIGPCSVTELARFLGRPRHALYYHVRALRDSGLLLETLHSGEGKKTTARYDLPGRPFSVRYDLDSEKTRRAILALGKTRLRSATRGFVRACDPTIAKIEGPRRNLWVTRIKGWLSDQELEEVNRHLRRLIDLMYQDAGRPGTARKCHELTFVLAPIVPQPDPAESGEEIKQTTIRSKVRLGKSASKHR